MKIKLKFENHENQIKFEIIEIMKTLKCEILENHKIVKKAEIGNS